MKRFFIFTAILLLCSSISLSAQWCSLGVKGGYSSILEQNQSYKEIFNSENKIQNGGHVGFFARLGKTWFVQPEILYNYYNLNSNINNHQKHYNIHTIDVPVLLGVHLLNVSLVKIRLMAGPKFNFNVGELESMQIENLIQNRRNTRLAFDCGVGFDVWRISLDLRYNLIQEALKIQDLEGNILNKKPQHTIQASLGFRLIGNNK